VDGAIGRTLHQDLADRLDPIAITMVIDKKQIIA
jgi:hypothetical protein